MFAGLSTTELALVVAEILVVVLGLAISYIAFMGYRRHDSRPMLFVSLGFVLLVGIPAVLTLIYLGTSVLGQELVSILNRLSTVFGLVSIFYGLWVDPD